MKKLVATLLLGLGLALVANVYAADNGTSTTKPTTTTSAPAAPGQ